jgi:hypothetical protein
MNRPEHERGRRFKPSRSQRHLPIVFSGPRLSTNGCPELKSQRAAHWLWENFMNEGQIREIYVRSMDANLSTFAAAEYEIAYHLLLVALQCGSRLSDISYLSEVERLAERESRYLDDHRPEYPYSNKAASRRGRLGVFQMAVQQAKTIVANIKMRKSPAPEVSPQTLA